MTTTPQQAGARLMIGFEGTTLTDALRRTLADTGAGGVILFARNIESAAQARDLIAAIRAEAGRPLLFAVDQEGGAVVRFTRDATVFPGFDQLVRRRRELGLSQTEVAARMGTSQSALARLESGRSDARMSTVARYAEALDADVGFLVRLRTDAREEE